MKLKDFFQISVNNIRRRKLRSWLTVIGIVIGITAIVSLMIIGRGMENAVEDAFEGFGSDVILMRGGVVAFGPPAAGEVGLTDDDRDAVERVKGIDYTVAFLYDTIESEFHGEELVAQVAGMEPEHMEDFYDKTRFGLEEGRFFNRGESGVAIIGHGIQNDFFEDRVGLKNRIRLGDQQFKVVGIVEEIGNAQDDFTIFVTLEQSRDLFDQPEGFTAMMAVVEPGVDVEETAERVEDALEDERGDENFQVFTATQLLDQITGVLAIVRFILVGIAAIALIVGAIGIMNTMYMSVIERTREIGIMKSIGATNGAVMGIFLVESAIFGVIGAVIGTGIGVGISWVVGILIEAAQLGIPFIIIIEPIVPTFAILFGAIVGTLSGFLPARNASKMNPVDALRYE